MRKTLVILFSIGAIFFIGAGIKVIGLAQYLNDGTYPGEIALLPWKAFSPAVLIFVAWSKHLKDF